MWIYNSDHAVHRWMLSNWRIVRAPCEAVRRSPTYTQFIGQRYSCQEQKELEQHENTYTASAAGGWS
jgi:hypothetical protein